MFINGWIYTVLRKASLVTVEKTVLKLSNFNENLFGIFMLLLPPMFTTYFYKNIFP